jgi:hypothetical protein
VSIAIGNASVTHPRNRSRKINVLTLLAEKMFLYE